jgi:hypothetical protein
MGTAVNAMAPGTVIGAWDSRDGLFVEVNHGGGYTSRYFHLSGFNTWVSFPANLVDSLMFSVGRGGPAQVLTCTWSCCTTESASTPGRACRDHHRRLGPSKRYCPVTRWHVRRHGCLSRDGARSRGCR